MLIRWQPTEDFGGRFRKYVQFHQLPKEALPGMEHAVSQYDGIVEVWADSVEDMKSAFASPGYKNVIHPDEANFCDEQ